MHTMKAWRYYGRRDLRLEEVPIPEPKDNEVLIQVIRCGICQTDLDEFMGGPKLFNKLPFTPGHEFGGKIVDVGKNVPGSLINDIVTVMPLVSCGQCQFCRAGMENLCNKRRFYGIIDYNGGFAEYAVVNKNNIIPVDNPEIVNFGEILTVGLRALNKAINYEHLEKKALIAGAGPVGLATALLFKKHGWHVEICEARKQRKDFATSFGFYTNESIYEFPERKFSVAVDCAGEDPVLPYVASELSLKILPGGAIILAGIYRDDIKYNALDLLANEIDLLPIFMYSSSDITNLQQTMNCMTNSLVKMVSRVVCLERLTDALIEIEANKDRYIKVVVSNENNKSA